MGTAGENRNAQALAYRDSVGLYFLPGLQGWWFHGDVNDTDACARVSEYERLRTGRDTEPLRGERIVHGWGRYSVVGRHSRTGYRELRPAAPNTQGAFRVTVVLLDPELEWSV